MNPVTKGLATVTAGGAALLGAADASGQEVVKPNHGETVKEIRLTSAELAELKGLPDITKASTDVRPDSFSAAELAARTRIDAHRITTKDTPLAPTIEAIAAEVGHIPEDLSKPNGPKLLDTREKKLDFARRILVGTNDNLEKGVKHAGTEGQRFLKGIEWLMGPERDDIFDVKNGFSRERLVSALVRSPIYHESMGSLLALARGKTTVPFITNFNEKLIRENKLVLNVKPREGNLVSNR